MNSKKSKNKNRSNKPPNPNPPQKTDPVAAEIVQDLPPDQETKVVPKLEERVPEIVSEIVTSSIETEKRDEDSPKKPKRNKGKKKKQEVDDDSQEEQPHEYEEIKIEKAEIPQELPTKTPEVTTEVTPSARKKKNKNKKSNEPDNKDAENPVKIAEETKLEQKQPEMVQILEKDTKNIAPKDNTLVDHEAKNKKKNKKKKNRTDSEKSEQHEEISCVSAFEELIKVEKTEVLLQPNTEEDKTSHLDGAALKTETDMISKVDEVKELNKEELKKEIEIHPKPALEAAPEAGGKHKKKNKKDNKNLQKSDESKDMVKSTDVAKEVETKLITDLLMDQLIPPYETVIVKCEIPEEIKIEDPVTETIEKSVLTEEVSKSKAIIAKPVERKKKGKTQHKDSGSETLSEQTEIQGQETPHAEVMAKGLSKLKAEKPIKELNIEEDKVIKQLEMEEETDELKIFTNIPPPACEMGKKRKKSPKLMVSETDVKPQVDNKTQLAVQHDQTKESEKNVPTADMTKLKEIKPTVLEKDSKQVEIKVEKGVELKADSPQPKDDRVIESKNKKKGKKSSKLPIETTSTKEIEENIIGESFATDSTMSAKPEEMVMASKKKDYVCDKIEFSCLKTEELEGSTSGVVPDIIQYPRATSQDLIDNNNNRTIIQEITTVEEIRLGLPIDISSTPLIMGSGETPIVTPETIIISNISPNVITKIDKPKEHEKTDIKSKMMEVNQDMEELRLSIERSLAELTAIEKSEENIDKDLTLQHLDICEQKDIIKPCMPSELVAKSPMESEKIDVIVSKDDKDIKHTSAEIKSFDVTESSRKSTSVEDESKNIPLKNLSDTVGSIKIIPTNEPIKTEECTADTVTPPVCPSRKDHKNKGKNKKKGKQEQTITAQTEVHSTAEPVEDEKEDKGNKGETKTEKKPEKAQEKGKQQSNASDTTLNDEQKMQTEQDSLQTAGDFDPIESFEDALTSSADDINKTFEIIATEANQTIEASHVNPEISITVPIEDTKPKKRDDKINPLSQPKNLLGHPDIPAPSNRIDYKKEKNKSPNETLAKVKIKDSIHVEGKRESKESQTENIRKFTKNKSVDESFSLMTNENEEFIYKYSFRKVFLQNACHVCKKDLKQARVPCGYCNLVFYCSTKHKDEDWSKHQGLCFAVSTIVHLKDQKHIYADSKDISGQNYRLLRMQMIVSCEKVLKRRLMPWEQEALLYPRMCADVGCREWRQSKLTDCEGCGQISFCSENPDHFPKIHQRWCKSYSLYCKLVCYQQTRGRLDPKMPSKVMVKYQIPDKMNEVLASMYDEKIDMNDIQYAALTQIATAPLTAAFSYQAYCNRSTPTNGTCKKTRCVVHVVGADLQFEADALNKWEVFFLHLNSAINELVVVLIATDLNPSNLPLELLSKVKLCADCRVERRKLVFNFQDKMTYPEYCASEEFLHPNIVCAFNASISRSTLYAQDPWPKTINCVLKLRVPFLATAYTIHEIHRDMARVKETAERKYEVLIEPKTNSFASLRPDRNFVSDDEMPLLFKNYCHFLVCGVC